MKIFHMWNGFAVSVVSLMSHSI
nr:unnamed protein product [Callosobruchus analis]